MSIRVERDGAIAHLLLDSPPRNEMDRAFFLRLEEVCRTDLAALARDPAVHGLVVTSAGRHFSSGANLAHLREAIVADREGAMALLRANIASFRAIERLPFRTVAAIKGCCLGSGLELALACDYRIAARRAAIGLPETTLGVIPGCGGGIRLAECIGRSRAVKMILSGAVYLAQEARAAGLVDAVVEKQHLLDVAVRYADGG
jgi:enoyl-CoA hydratase/carnithine racemase